MEETYNIKALILNRKPFSENGSSVTVYSENFGKLELIARGTKKIKSKLACHLEPISLSDIMVVKGRRHNYIGAVESENCYASIKNDFDKIKAAGEAVKVFNLIIKAGEKDREIFYLLKNYFDFLNGAAGKTDYDLSAKLFILKLLIKAGHGPELRKCVVCGNKIQPLGNRFDQKNGGFACAQCLPQKIALQPSVSENAIKILRLAGGLDFKELSRISLNNNVKKEVLTVISLFFAYNFSC
ncbi:MAG: DNA repair protein RecO [bacterium]